MVDIVVLDPAPGVEGSVAWGEAQAFQKSRRGKVGYLSRELRIRLFEEVWRLRRKDLTYGEIIDEVRQRYGVRLSKSHVSYWLRGMHNPRNGRHIPSIDFLRPSEELAYVVGVVVGDGYTYRWRRVIRGYNLVKIGLKVKDPEFAVEFGRCVARVLGRITVKPRYRNSIGRYVIEVNSQTLYELLKKPADLERLKKYVEHCKKCMAAFVRGFADSEGCVDCRGYIYISNTDEKLLEYVKYLLGRLKIESTGPHCTRQKGKTFYDPKEMKRYPYRKDCYRIRIRADSILRFYSTVGLTIGRKRRRVEEYLGRRQAKPPSLIFPSCNQFIDSEGITESSANSN